MRSAALIAVDWGTTHARAYRLDDAGSVLGVRAAPLGIGKLGDLAYPDALARLLGDWIDESVPRIACGMVGSRQGWHEAPYVDCPASLAALSRGLVEAGPGGIAIVPGLATRDAAGVPDVMRGEETQILGAVPADSPRTLVVLPGTHSKWASVECGVVRDFTTCMTGELHEALVRHTILGRLADGAPGADVAAAFDRGVERGLGAGGFTHDVFGARTLALAGELAPGDVTEWLSGLLVGREIRDTRRWAEQAGDDATRVLVVASEVLAARYLRAFERAGIEAVKGPADAAATGLFRIACAAGLVAVETA
ncbi:MAG: 2-dehydro-3-deoxygalactonokinase [Burkholderiales bacterium]|nr:2-dehydro-3-deoxygalactonokinase [Burkholderiales bacterium]